MASRIIIIPIEIMVLAWTGPLPFGTRPFYTDFNGTNFNGTRTNSHQILPVDVFVMLHRYKVFKMLKCKKVCLFVCLFVCFFVMLTLYTL